MTTPDRFDGDEGIDAPSPRVERALDQVHDALERLIASPTSASGQEVFCLATRRAVSLLRVAFGDRGGHYRSESIERAARLFGKGIRIMRGHPVPGETSEKLIPSIERRVQWVKNALPRRGRRGQ